MWMKATCEFYEQYHSIYCAIIGLMETNYTAEVTLK